MSEGRGLQPVSHSGRLGGGGSARLIALAVVVVLGGFIAIGVMGRGPAAPPVAEAPRTPLPTGATSVTSPSHPPASPTPAATPSPFGAVERITASSPAPGSSGDRLAAVLEAAGTMHMALLERTGSGQWVATYLVPYPRPALEGRLVLTQVNAPAGTSRLTLGRWPISFEPMTPEWERAGVVLDAVEPATDNPGAHPLASDGYHIVVVASSRLYYGLLTVYVERQPTIELDESYVVELSAGQFATGVALANIRPGRYSGVLLIPDRPRVGSLNLVLLALPTQSGSEDGALVVHEYVTELPWPEDFVAGQTLMSANVDAFPGAAGPDLLRYDHDLSVEATYVDGQRALILTLQVHEPVDADDDFADMSTPWPPRDYPGPSLGD
jgi:hypothetical protein